MKKPLLSALAGLALSACVSAQTSAPIAVPASDSAKPFVVIITIDGFPARALDDPRLPMPTLRALIANGAVAKGMQPINPTVTWPNHTAMITGVNATQHHVIANGLVSFPTDGTSPTVKPWVDKDQLVYARTLYEAAAEKGLTTAQVDWVAIYGAHGVTWDFGEKPDADGVIPEELVAQGLATRDEIANFGKSSSPAWHDEIWTDAAVDIIEQHHPNLLLFHLLETDSIQHAYGPLTSAAYAAYAYADTCIARVVEAVRATGLLPQTTFFFMSDHGFATYTRTIRPNAALVEEGILHKEGAKYHGSVWVKAEGGAAHVYIHNPADREALIPKLKALFEKTPGIAHVYTNQEARAIGIPSDAETDQAPQLYLTAQPNYAFVDEVTGPVESDNPARGTHGYLNTGSDMEALFVASGAHIKSGVKLGQISNLNAAPTIAQILGVSLPDAKSKPLTEILK